MANHRSDVVTATVPVEWLGHFVLHHVWVRPPNSQADYYQLIDVVIDETGRRNMVVHVGGVKKHALCAQKITVKGVLKSYCKQVKVGEGEWWEWEPPQDRQPPEWPHAKTATVTARVPEEWLPRFIGHKVQTHLPVVRGTVEYNRMYTMVDVYEVIYELAHPGNHFYNVVVDTDLGHTAMSVLSYPCVDEVPQHECHDENGVFWWQPPNGEQPPAVEIRARTWTPQNTLETDAGAQHLLF